MICKLCGDEVSKGAKAHIVPEAFCREARGEDGKLVIVSLSRSRPVQRATVGIYDQNLVCIDCEKRFNDSDNYAAAFLIQQLDSAAEVLPDGQGSQPSTDTPR